MRGRGVQWRIGGRERKREVENWVNEWSTLGWSGDTMSSLFLALIHEFQVIFFQRVPHAIRSQHPSLYPSVNYSSLAAYWAPAHESGNYQSGSWSNHILMAWTTWLHSHHGHSSSRVDWDKKCFLIWKFEKFALFNCRQFLWKWWIGCSCSHKVRYFSGNGIAIDQIDSMI